MPNNKIAIVLENRPEWPAVFFSILSVGDVAVPLDPKASLNDLGYFLEHSDSVAVYTSNRFIHKIKSDSVKIINVDELPVGALDKNFSYPSVDESSVAVILYTSGTTGKPKGVMLTHGNLLSNFRSIEKLGLFREKENILSVLPFFHSFPLMVTLIIPVLSGSQITFVDEITTESIFKILCEEPVTVFPGVPQLFQLIANGIKNEIDQKIFYFRWLTKGLIECGYLFQRFLNFNVNKIAFKKIHMRFGQHLKYLVSGGAKLDVGVEKFLTKLGFTLIEGYGLTETSPVLTFTPPGKIKWGSAGKPIPGVELKIDGGEILARGPNVMLGYYKNEAATKEAIVDGWFHTGDLGYLDSENYLFITGRKKEIIVLPNGKNISPDELERYFLKSPYIKEICVFMKNEKLQAVVCPDFDYFQKQREVNFLHTIQFQIETLSAALPSYQHLMGFSVSKIQLPKTSLGKLKRHEISQLLDQEKKEKVIAENELEIVSSERWRVLEKLIQKKLSEKTVITPSDNLEIDLGIDSLKRIELFSEIRQVFGTLVPDAIISNVVSARDLFYLLKESKGMSEGGLEQKTWSDILKTDPQGAILNKIMMQPSVLDKMILSIAIKTTKLFAKCYWRLKVDGIENLPKDTPFILCANHNSYLDAELIAWALPKDIQEKMFFLGYSGVFEKPFFKQLARIAKVIPIDPAAQLVDAMQAAGYVLRNKKCLCVFPEGGRSIDGKIKPFKSGVGILIKEFKLPVIPAYIQGSFESWPRGKKLPKPHAITVRFGKLIQPEELIQNDKSHKAIAEGLQRIVGRMALNEW